MEMKTVMKQGVVNLRKFLRDHMNGIPHEMIDAWLQKTGSVIAGSLVLCSVLNSQWCNIDVDVWTPLRKYDDSADSLKQILDVANYSELSSKTLASNRSCTYTRLNKYVERITSYESAISVPLQVISLKSGFSAEDVVKSFDIIATQLMYDGRNIIFVDKMAPPQTMSKSIQFSVSALTEQSPLEWLRTAERVRKYGCRGFSIIDKEWEKAIMSLGDGITKILNDDSKTRKWTCYFPSQNHSGDGIEGWFFTKPWHEQKSCFLATWNQLVSGGPVPFLSLEVIQTGSDNEAIYAWSFHIKGRNQYTYPILFSNRNDWTAMKYDPELHGDFTAEDVEGRFAEYT